MRTDVCQHNDSTIIPDGIRKLRINIVVIFCKKEKIYNIAAGISLLVQNNPTGDASHKFYSRFSQTVMFPGLLCGLYILNRDAHNAKTSKR